jgi:hypothetical protein
MFSIIWTGLAIFVEAEAARFAGDPRVLLSLLISLLLAVACLMALPERLP